MPKSGCKALESCQNVGNRELLMLAERNPTKQLREGEGLVCFSNCIVEEMPISMLSDISFVSLATCVWGSYVDFFFFFFFLPSVKNTDVS